MSLDDAANHLAAAVGSIAMSDEPPFVRLQGAWTAHVQMVWMRPCLTRDLLREFRDLWEDYTAPSDDNQSTVLRDLSPEETRHAIERLVSFAITVAVAAADSSEPLATLADL